MNKILSLIRGQALGDFNLQSIPAGQAGMERFLTIMRREHDGDILNS